MKGARFDILFTGELIPQAQPDQVRLRLQERFKLSAEAASRLFAGETVTIKRGVDAETVARYRKAFRDAGALIRTRAAASSGPAAAPTSARDERPEEQPAAAGEGDLQPQPHPRTSAPTEQAPAHKPAAIDTSHLRLVPGRDWTLEDCHRPPPPAALPDTSHLRLVPAAAEDEV